VEAPDGIAVFGSSAPDATHPLYARARELGALLAQAGRTVVTGGYGGVMEGACRGAIENGGKTVGVTCDVFSRRRPNPYLTEVVRTQDLFDRTRELVRRSAGFIVLDGQAGTLSELAFLWALQRAGCLDGRPVVLLDARWRILTDGLAGDGILEPAQLAATHAAADPAAAVELLQKLLSRSPDLE
jgi:uncharacterized protein (TIGR00730 family)